MSADRKQTPSQLLSEIQSRYRSDRFNPAGDRFGYIEFDPEKQCQRDLNRRRRLEEQRVVEMNQVLAEAAGISVEELREPKK